VKGQPIRFRLGHANRTKQRPPVGAEDYREEDRGHDTPCWIRIGHLNNKGYGKVAIAGKQQYAHRAMYEQEVGPIPPGAVIDHLCRQRDCMRPEHLEATTMATNLQRGRNAKLTPQAVREIRTFWAATVSTKELAEAYGISASQMSRVRRGLRWRNVEE
jgi:hypothetical protein